MFATLRPQPTVAVISFRSEPADAIVDRFRAQIAELWADAKCGEIVVDFESFPFISSQLINELIRSQLELRLQDRSLRLVHVLPQVADVMRLLRLDRTIEFSTALPCCESEQVGFAIRHRVDKLENFPTFYLRRFADRTLSLLHLRHT